MKTLSRVALAALLFTATGCVGPLVYSGNGDSRTEVRALEDFSRIHVTSSVPITVRQGTAFRVTVTGDSNLLQYIFTDLSGDTLTVGVDTPGGYTGVNFHVDPMVDVELPALAEVQLSSSGGAAISGISSDAPVALTVESSGSLDFSGNAPRIDVRDVSSGSVELVGTTDLLTVDVNSSGSVKAKAMNAHSAELATSSSGNIRATLTGGTVTLEVTSSGSIDWWGSATVTSERDTSSGHITHHDAY